MAIQIRKATKTDAAAAINTLHRSIIELCIADHHNVPAEVEDWLSNKTVEAWQKWIARDDALVLVAQQDSEVVGVGMTTLSGEILLNYVHPNARFGGVSKAILAAMEGALRTRGVQHCRLESTITAHSFYQNCGFQSEPGNTLLLSKSLKPLGPLRALRV